MSWKFEIVPKSLPRIKKSVLIVGLPGIGNVGKIAADFIIDEIKAAPIYSIFSYNLPNSVFVNEHNLVELPTIEIYHKRIGGVRDMLVLTGDVQPADEQSSYEFCEAVLDKAKNLGVELVITLGGIGLADIPKKPQVFCTGNSKKEIKEFNRGIKINEKLYGIVGPIIGVSGLLIGLAQRRKMPAVCLLAETFSHPAYLGIKGAREILRILNKKLGLRIRISELDKEIADIEAEIMDRSYELGKLSKKSALKKIQSRMHKERSYIG